MSNRTADIQRILEDQDPQLTAGERRSSGETGRIRIVGDQQHSKPRMLSSGVVDKAHHGEESADEDAVPGEHHQRRFRRWGSRALAR